MEQIAGIPVTHERILASRKSLRDRIRDHAQAVAGSSSGARVHEKLAAAPSLRIGNGEGPISSFWIWT